MEPSLGPPLPRFLKIYWPWYKPPVGKLGDLNDDGRLDEKDLRILAEYVLLDYSISDISPLSEAEFLRRADINGDGKIDVLDITALREMIEEAPVEKVVTITLKNYPAVPPDTAWTFYLWEYVTPYRQVVSGTIWDFDAPVIFDIPPDWVFPLRFECGIIHYLEEGAYEVIYIAQSLSATYPNYVAEFIPSPGSYYYNVAAEKFEKV